MKKKLQTLLCICVMVLMLPMSVFAAPADDACSLTIQYPSGGALFSFYKVAEFSEYGEFDVIAPFDAYMDEIQELDNLENHPDAITTDTWRSLATTLDTYVGPNKIAYDFTCETNAEGIAAIEGIDKGLYLVTGEPVVIDEIVYTTSPVLMTVPNRDAKGAWENQVIVDYSGKLSAEDIDEYTAVKIWDDEGFENNRPDELKVTLYKDGERYSTAVLNEDNNWEYKWTKLPQGASWSVKEDKVPAGYKVTYVKESDATIIENVLVPAKTPSQSGGKLPQTGQLWWPVPILAILGIAFFAIGWARRNSGER